MVRRQQQLDSSVTGTRRRGRRGPEQQEFSRAGMIYGADGDPPRRGSSRVSVFASPSAAPVFVHSPELANIKPLSHNLYGSNTGSNQWRKCTLPSPRFRAKEQQKPELKYIFLSSGFKSCICQTLVARGRPRGGVSFQFQIRGR